MFVLWFGLVFNENRGVSTHLPSLDIFYWGQRFFSLGLFKTIVKFKSESVLIFSCETC